MTATASPTQHLPLGADEREQVGRELQATLVELIDLSPLGKQLHWSVVGPLFRPLHQQLDEFVGSWRDLADTVAERAVAVGFWPDGQAAAASHEHTTVGRGAVADHAAVGEITRRLAAVSERTREAHAGLQPGEGADGDPGLLGDIRQLRSRRWRMSRRRAPIVSSGAPSSSSGIRLTLLQWRTYCGLQSSQFSLRALGDTRTVSA